MTDNMQRDWEILQQQRQTDAELARQDREDRDIQNMVYQITGNPSFIGGFFAGIDLVNKTVSSIQPTLIKVSVTPKTYARWLLFPVKGTAEQGESAREIARQMLFQPAAAPFKDREAYKQANSQLFENPDEVFVQEAAGEQVKAVIAGPIIPIPSAYKVPAFLDLKAAFGIPKLGWDMGDTYAAVHLPLHMGRLAPQKYRDLGYKTAGACACTHYQRRGNPLFKNVYKAGYQDSGWSRFKRGLVKSAFNSYAQVIGNQIHQVFFPAPPAAVPAQAEPKGKGLT